MGYFRLFLATLVLVSHMGISFGGINPGVAAVAIFYLLAGQVVVRLWLRFPGSGWAARTLAFYRDRLFRILPMYLAMLAVAWLAWTLGAQSYFLARSPAWHDWANNLLIVPLNYYMFSGADHFTLLPPAWSLAAELQFYILIPFLLAARNLLLSVFLLSLAIFCAAQTGWINTDVYGYRLLPGVLFVFLSGGLLEMYRSTGHSLHGARIIVLLLGTCWLVMACWAVYLLAAPAARVPFNTEVALGYAAGLPIMFARAHLGSRVRALAGHKLAGVLSYGVFLVHFPAIWLLELVKPGLGGSFVLVFVLSLLLAILAHYGIEKPLWRRFR